MHQWCPLYRDSTVEKKESVFSHVYRTLTPQSGSLQMDQILSRFLTFQQNRQEKKHVVNITPLRMLLKKLKKLDENLTSNIIVHVIFLTSYF